MICTISQTVFGDFDIRDNNRWFILARYHITGQQATHLDYGNIFMTLLICQRRHIDRQVIKHIKEYFPMHRPDISYKQINTIKQYVQLD